MSALSKYLNMGVNLASVLIFSRLLTPDELGVHVVAVAIAALAIEVRLLGTGGYLIRKEVITKHDCQRVIGVTMMISFPLGGAMFASSNWVGGLFEQEGIASILAILSLGFFSAPFIAVSHSILSRNFRFDVLLLNNVLTTVITFVASLVAFYMHAGYMSLAIGLVVGQLSKLLVFWLYKSTDISWRPSFSGFAEILKFGMFVSQAAVLRKLHETSPEIIIGKLGSPTLAAVFSRGVGLYKFFFDSVTSAVQPVVMPFLSKAKRSKKDVKESYLNAVSHLSILVIPILSVLSISAKPAVLLMFGDQWLESVEFVPVLCLLGIVRCVYCWANTLLVTMGFEKANFYRQCVITSCTVLFCSIGFSISLLYVAWAMVLTAIIDALLLGLAIRKNCNIGIGAIAKAHSKSIVVGILCCALTKLLYIFLELDNVKPIYVLLVLSVIIPIFWLNMVFLFRHPLANLIKGYFEILKNRINF
nr:MULTISPECIES: oligosaccharide flippase family protein [unclassified Alteromonas]